MADSVQLPETSLWQNRKCLLICCAVSIANMQYGYDSSAVGGLQAMPGFLKVFGFPDPSSYLGYGIEATVQQLMTSLMLLGSFVSSLMAGSFSVFFGRKLALWIACACSVVAAILQIASTDKVGLYVGRFFLGFSNGWLVTFSNIYTSEVAPAHLRGVLVALFCFWVNFGAVWGTLVDNYTAKRLDNSSYQIPLGCLFIVPMVLGISLFFVPESPRYLVFRGRDEKARKSLRKLRGDSLTPDYFELEWAEIVRGIEEEKQEAKRVGWIDMFRGSDLRRTLLCYGVIASQTASGSWFLIAYQVYFLILGGVTKGFEYSMMNAVLGWVGAIFGMYAMVYLCGRRPLLILGGIVCGFCQLAPAIAATVAPLSKPAIDTLIAFTAIFWFAYDACVGAASYPVATELVSTRLRAWTVGTATSLGYLLAWTVAFCTPYFINPTELNWGAQYGYIWAGSNFASAIFFYLFVPEMKGRSLEEVDELFRNRVSVRNFSKYRTTLGEQAMHDVQVEKGLFADKTAGTTTNVVQIEHVRHGGRE